MLELLSNEVTATIIAVIIIVACAIIILKMTKGCIKFLLLIALIFILMVYVLPTLI